MLIVHFLTPHDNTPNIKIELNFEITENDCFYANVHNLDEKFDYFAVAFMTFLHFRKNMFL
jgi:hypothetical protein